MRVLDLEPGMLFIDKNPTLNRTFFVLNIEKEKKEITFIWNRQIETQSFKTGSALFDFLELVK